MKFIFVGLIALSYSAAAADGQVAKNILGEPLEACSTVPMAGAFREGHCRTGPEDAGVHVVCAKVTKDFLEYTGRQGNDLVTPAPEFRFPGLKPGDKWCLCADRWVEARDAGVAPPVEATATDEAALKYAPLMSYRQQGK